MQHLLSAAKKEYEFVPAQESTFFGIGSSSSSIPTSNPAVLAHLGRLREDLPIFGPVNPQFTLRNINRRLAAEEILLSGSLLPKLRKSHDDYLESERKVSSGDESTKELWGESLKIFLKAKNDYEESKAEVAKAEERIATLKMEKEVATAAAADAESAAAAAAAAAAAEAKAFSKFSGHPSENPEGWQQFLSYKSKQYPEADSRCSRVVESPPPGEYGNGPANYFRQYEWNEPENGILYKKTYHEPGSQVKSRISERAVEIDRSAPQSPKGSKSSGSQGGSRRTKGGSRRMKRGVGNNTTRNKNKGSRRSRRSRRSRHIR